MIRIENLTKKYGDFTAVDGISLQVEPGEIYGFLGPNGAGKTTTIRIAAGLSVPTTGRVIVGGYDVVSHPTAAKAITGYIPDRPFLYEKLTGYELLHFLADLYRKPWSEARKRAGEYLEYFGLEEWANARIENYSHGMKQKLVLVGSLLHEPSVLIIDEPMVGLDALAQKLVKELLRKQASEGKTVFMTTHTLSVAESICDRIAILHRGRIAAEGTTTELRERAKKSGALEELFLEITYDEATTHGA